VLFTIGVVVGVAKLFISIVSNPGEIREGKCKIKLFFIVRSKAISYRPNAFSLI